MFLKHIKQDVIIKDRITNSLHQSLQGENNAKLSYTHTISSFVVSFDYTSSLFLVIGTLSF